MAAAPPRHFLLTCWNPLSYCQKCYSLDLLCQNCHTARFSLQINYWQLLSSNMWWKKWRMCLNESYLAVWLQNTFISLATANKNRCLRAKAIFIFFYFPKTRIHFNSVFLRRSLSHGRAHAGPGAHQTAQCF